MTQGLNWILFLSPLIPEPLILRHFSSYYLGHHYYLLYFVSVVINQNVLGVRTFLHLSQCHWNLEVAQGLFWAMCPNICFRKPGPCAFPRWSITLVSMWSRSYRGRESRAKEQGLSVQEIPQEPLCLAVNSFSTSKSIRWTSTTCKAQCPGLNLRHWSWP